jgi:hypothetical protein
MTNSWPSSKHSQGPMALYGSSRYSSIKSQLMVLFSTVILHLGISKDIWKAPFILDSYILLFKTVFCNL